MTPGQIEKSIKRLKKRVCCLLSEETITEGSLSGVRSTYKKLLNSVVAGIPTRVTMLEELDKISKLIKKLEHKTCCSIVL